MYKITNLLQETVKRNHILEYTLSLVGIKLTKKWWFVGINIAKSGDFLESKQQKSGDLSELKLQKEVIYRNRTYKKWC
jgi:hypothetical protein